MRPRLRAQAYRPAGSGYFRVQGLSGLGLGVLGFRVYGLGLGALGFRARGFRV